MGKTSHNAPLEGEAAAKTTATTAQPTSSTSTTSRSASRNADQTKDADGSLPPITVDTPRTELAALVKAHADRLFQRETENRWLFEMIREEEANNFKNTFESKRKHIESTIAVRGKYTDSKAYRSYQEAGNMKRLDQELNERLKEEAAKAEEGRAGRPMLSREVPTEARRDPLAFAEDMLRWEQNRQAKIEKKADKLQREKDTAVCGVPKISSISEQIIEARRREDPSHHPSYYSPEGVDQRIAEHRRKLEEIKKKHEPSFKPTITPHESLARRSAEQQLFFQNLSTGAGAGTDLSGVTATTTFSPERLYALSKELKEKQAAREMSAIPQTNCKKKSEAEIAQHLQDMQQRAEENERRKKFAAKRKAKETDELENNGFKPSLNPNTDALVEQYKSKEEKRNAKKEEQQRLREAQLAAEAARPIVVKTAPTRTEEFLFHNERTMQKRSETLEKLQKEKEEKFSQSHTFSPSINNVSRKIATQMSQELGGPTFFETTEAQLWRQQAVEESLEQQYYQQQKELMLSGHRPESARFFVKGANTTSSMATFDRQRAKEYAQSIPAPTVRSTSARKDRDPTSGSEKSPNGRIGGAIEVTPNSKSPGSGRGEASVRIKANGERGGEATTAPALQSNTPEPYRREDDSNGGGRAESSSTGRPSDNNAHNNASYMPLKTNSLDWSGPINYVTNLSTPAEVLLSAPPPPSQPSALSVDNAVRNKDIGEDPVSDEEIGTPRDPRRQVNSSRQGKSERGKDTKLDNYASSSSPVPAAIEH